MYLTQSIIVTLFIVHVFDPVHNRYFLEGRYSHLRPTFEQRVQSFEVSSDAGEQLIFVDWLLICYLWKLDNFRGFCEAF